jgi:lipoprotein NlpI
MQSALLLLLVVLGLPQDTPTEADVFRAIQARKLDEAESLASKRIAADDKSSRGYLIRAAIREQADKLPQAIEDFTAALARTSNEREKAGVINGRGMLYFKNGQIKESIDDFDAFLKLAPGEGSRHWQRGIALYYAGRFDDGRKQFEACEKNYHNDVENVVWRAMCIARKDGFDKARTTMAEVGPDRRVPMTTIYKLFKDEAKPDDVMKQGQAPTADPNEAKMRQFYSHLYIGLYSEIKGDKVAAREHLQKAVDLYSPPGQYMWAVARTHLKLLEKQP